MKIARLKNTNKPFEAEELKFLDEENMPEFICPDENCAVPLIPASFKSHNKQRPHFRTLRKNDHSKTCKYSEFARILELGGKRKITFEEFENLPVPTKLIIPKDKGKNEVVKSKNGESQDDNPDSIKRKGFNGDFDESGNNIKNVTTISQIVDFYLSCPFNRDIELTIFEEKKQYMKWFKRLQKTQRNKEPQELNIYFGQLHQDNHLNIDGSEIIRMKMFDCEKWEKATDGYFNSVSKVQVNPFYVQIDPENISPHKLSRLKNEIEFARNEQTVAFKEGKQDKRKPFVFFIGKKIDINNPFEYKVLDNHLVARYTEIRDTVMD
jgi:hypothetical protein